MKFVAVSIYVEICSISMWSKLKFEGHTISSVILDNDTLKDYLVV